MQKPLTHQFYSKYDGKIKMLTACFATNLNTLNEVMNQINLTLQVKPIVVDKIYLVVGTANDVMRLIGRFSDNGEDCLYEVHTL